MRQNSESKVNSEPGYVGSVFCLIEGLNFHMEYHGLILGLLESLYSVISVGLSSSWFLSL